MTIPAAFVGLDVNRTGIQAMVRPTREQWAMPIDDCGIDEIAARLIDMQPKLVVLEARGALELPVAGGLAIAGLPFALVPPRSIREFARAIGRVRQDADQAEVLACFAELVRPEPRPMPPELVQHMRALKERRQEVLDMLTLERGRVDGRCTFAQKDIRNHVYFLERSAFSLSEEINRTVRCSNIWR